MIYHTHRNKYNSFVKPANFNLLHSISILQFSFSIQGKKISEYKLSIDSKYKCNSFMPIKIKVLILYILTVFIFIANSKIAAATHLQTTLNQSSQLIHPHLIFSVDDISSFKIKITKGRSLNSFNLMKARADSYLTLKTTPYTFSGAISGRSLEVQLLDLALTGYLTDNINYINKAIQILCAVAEQSDVNIFYGFNSHLSIGDMAKTYAMAYDWLEPYMTSSQKQLIEDEIYDFGQWLYGQSLVQFWGSEEPRRLAHNHQVVTHGALGLCGLVLGDKAPKTWVDRATIKIKHYFDYAIDSTGCAYEGMGYLAYGLHHSIPFAEALRRSGGQDIIMEKLVTKFIPEYYLRQLLPWGAEGVMINQSENTVKPSGEVLHLISRHQDNVGLWGWDRMIGDSGDKSYGQNPWLGTGASLPYVIIWEDQQLEAISPADANLSTNRFFVRGQISSRDGWETENSFLTFTSGFGWQGCWNHPDVNNFTFYAKGGAWSIDPGPGYTKTDHHSVITVNGEGQDWTQGGDAPIGKVIGYRADSLATYVKGDATSAYQRFVKAKKSVRQLLYVKGEYPYVIIVDDFELKEVEEKDYQWRLTTSFKNSITNDLSSGIMRVSDVSAQSTMNIYCLYPESFSFNQNLDPNSKYKQLVLSSKGNSGKFVVIMFATKSGETVPKLTKMGDINNMELLIEMGNGLVDSIKLNLEYIQFKRFSTNTNSIQSIVKQPLTITVNKQEIAIKGDVSDNNLTAVLYDAKGKAVLRQNLLKGNVNIIPTTNLRQGIYFFFLSDGQNKVTHKVLII